MNIKLLVDAIVQQTTVLIAQLATSAGVRAPLAHLADQVFLSLSREIEAQGVGRKVAADMFGLALRGYQKKTQRAAASATHQGRTLFEAILEYVEREGGSGRDALFQRFRHDNEREVVGVLNDLVHSGLLYSTGTGRGTLYGVTSESERQRLTRESDAEGLANMALGAIYRSPASTTEEVGRLLNVTTETLEPVLSVLLTDGRVQRTGQHWFAPTFQIPVGAERGWEAAVFDHFQAVATALGNKVQSKSGSAPDSEYIGGTTIRFEVSRTHPHLAKVLDLLRRVRDLTDEVWAEVAAANECHPIAEGERVLLTFYFGQNVDDLTLLEQRSALSDED